MTAAEAPCVCGHDREEHSPGATICLAVTATNHPGDLFCTCWEYDPGPEF